MNKTANPCYEVSSIDPLFIVKFNTLKQAIRYHTIMVKKHPKSVIHIYKSTDLRGGRA